MRPIVTDRVAWSVGLSQYSEPCKNGWTDRNAVWVENSGGAKEYIRRVHVPHGKGQFWAGKGRPIAKYRGILRSSVQKRLNRSKCRLGYGIGWAKEACIRWARSPMQRGNYYWKGHTRTCPTTLCHELCKNSWGLWIWVGRRKHKVKRVWQVAPMCPNERAHCSHLTNTIEPPVCGGDAALCQITLTTCYY